MMANRRVAEYARKIGLLTVILILNLQTVQGDIREVFNDGMIFSENYPDVYPNNHVMIWRFKISPSYRLKLIFGDFVLESCSICECDYVAVYDGPSENHPLLGQFCGTTLPHSIMTSRGDILIKFHTDGSRTEKGFRMRHFIVSVYMPLQTERYLTQYFLKPRQQEALSIKKWGTDITRAAVALYLYDPEFFAAGNETGEKIAYELSLQLMSKLVMKKRISTKDLALFINAMTVACINPRKFFGVNVVGELLRRVDSNNHTINPFFILALCNAGESVKPEYVDKLQHLFTAHLRPSWAGTQAMVFMAVKCISKHSSRSFNFILSSMMADIKTKQHSSGAVENLKTTALVIQAISATETFETNFNMSMGIKSILEEMEVRQLTTEELYYILPFLNRKYLADINSNHCTSIIKTDLEGMKLLTRELVDERIQVQVSVFIGDDMDFSRTWKIKVPSNSSLYDIAERNISSSDLNYKIQYTVSEGKPYIAGLGNFQDSIEDGLFWFIYIKSSLSNGDLVLIEESPVDIQIKEADEFILWYKSNGTIPKHSTQQVSTATTDLTSITDNTTDILPFADNITDLDYIAALELFTDNP